jgi:hypothetical protein
MKNDTETVQTVTSEMSINDFNYAVMREEYDRHIISIGIGEYDDDIYEGIERAYFYKRVLSVLSDNDIPLRAAIGLMYLPYPLAKLYEDKEKHIGERDADTDVYEYVLEYGYRVYEKRNDPGDRPEYVLRKLVKKVSKNV